MCASMSVCVFVLLRMRRDCSLTTIISDLQSAQPAKAQGHLWTQTFSSFARHYFTLPFLPFIHTHHSLIILSCSFLLVHSPSELSVFLPLPPNTSPVHLSHRAFYQLIHSFCSTSAGLVSPISLYLGFSCCSGVPSLCLSLLLSLWVLSIFPCCLWETQNRLHMCTRTNVQYALHTYTDGHAHTCTRGQNPSRKRLLP